MTGTFFWALWFFAAFVASSSICLGDTADSLAEVQNAYSSLTTYRDTARVVSAQYDANGKQQQSDRKPRLIKTAFQRDAAFRFEYRDPNPRQVKDWDKLSVRIAWQNGNVFKQWPKSRSSTYKNTSEAEQWLSVKVGVTEGTSVVVPPLLLFQAEKEKDDPHGDSGSEIVPKRSKPKGFADLHQKAVRLQGEVVLHEKVVCHRLQDEITAVNFQDGTTFEVITTFWIENSSHLIHRYQQEMKFSDGSRNVVLVDYSPEINVLLEPSELDFKPPN